MLVQRNLKLHGCAAEVAKLHTFITQVALQKTIIINQHYAHISTEQLDIMFCLSLEAYNIYTGINL